MEAAHEEQRKEMNNLFENQRNAMVKDYETQISDQKTHFEQDIEQ
jgi:hypothetical protein